MVSILGTMDVVPCRAGYDEPAQLCYGSRVRELEFWFAAIKIVTILFMIVSGIGIICFGFGNGGVATGIGNLWRHGGFMPNGWWGLASALPMVVFAYLGVEIIGLTAGETKNPEKSLSRAVNSVFWRIAIFYIVRCSSSCRYTRGTKSVLRAVRSC